MIVGDKVKSLRESLGYSQADLARMVGISQPIIHAIESGAQLTSKALPRIAKALKTEISELDADYPVGTNGLCLSPEAAGTAMEVVLAQIRPDLSAEDRKSLARVFLDLAQEPLDDSSAEPLEVQMRFRLQLLIKPYLPR